MRGFMYYNGYDREYFANDMNEFFAEAVALFGHSKNQKFTPEVVDNFFADCFKWPLEKSILIRLGDIEDKADICLETPYIRTYYDDGIESGVYRVRKEFWGFFKEAHFEYLKNKLIEKGFAWTEESREYDTLFCKYNVVDYNENPLLVQLKDRLFNDHAFNFAELISNLSQESNELFYNVYNLAEDPYYLPVYFSYDCPTRKYGNKMLDEASYNILKEKYNKLLHDISIPEKAYPQFYRDSDEPLCYLNSLLQFNNDEDPIDYEKLCMDYILRRDIKRTISEMENLAREKAMLAFPDIRKELLDFCFEINNLYFEEPLKGIYSKEYRCVILFINNILGKDSSYIPTEADLYKRDTVNENIVAEYLRQCVKYFQHNNKYFNMNLDYFDQLVNEGLAEHYVLKYAYSHFSARGYNDVCRPVGKYSVTQIPRCFARYIDGRETELFPILMNIENPFRTHEAVHKMLAGTVELEEIILKK